MQIYTIKYIIFFYRYLYLRSNMIPLENVVLQGISSEINLLTICFNNQVGLEVRRDVLRVI